MARGVLDTDADAETEAETPPVLPPKALTRTFDEALDDYVSDKLGSINREYEACAETLLHPRPNPPRAATQNSTRGGMR